MFALTRWRPSLFGALYPNDTSLGSHTPLLQAGHIHYAHPLGDSTSSFTKFTVKHVRTREFFLMSSLIRCHVDVVKSIQSELAKSSL